MPFDGDSREKHYFKNTGEPWSLLMAPIMTALVAGVGGAGVGGAGVRRRGDFLQPISNQVTKRPSGPSAKAADGK